MSDNRFQQAEDRYMQLRGELETRRITRDQFQSALDNLMVQDAEGRMWKLGAGDGKWYMFNGQTWVQQSPPARLSANTPPAPVAPAPIPSAPRTAKRGISILPVVAIGCIGLICVAVFGVLLLVASQRFLNIALLSNTPTPTAQPVLPTPIATAVLPTAPISTAPAPAPALDTISGAVMARDVQGNNYDPVGVTDTFAANQPIYHAVVTVNGAPSNTSVRAVWNSATAKLGEYEIKTDGSRNLDFTFKPDGGGLPTGSYHVDIYLNGTLNRTLNFTVAGGAGTPAPAPSLAPSGSGIIASVTLALGAQSDTKQPINPTTVFPSNAVFHAVVATQNAPANTKIRATWYAVDVGNVAPPNTLIDSSELMTDGSRDIDFTLSPNSVWAVGTYRVEIAVNGNVEQVVNFSVK